MAVDVGSVGRNVSIKEAQTCGTFTGSSPLATNRAVGEAGGRVEPLPAPLKVLRLAHRRLHRAPHRGGGPRRRRGGADGEPPAGRRVGWLRRGCLPAVAEEVQEGPPPVCLVSVETSYGASSLRWFYCCCGSAALPAYRSVLVLVVEPP
jgi:hypothetical protein